MTKRNKPLYAQAVDEALPALTGALEAEGVALRFPRPVVQAVVRAYLAVAVDIEARRVDGRISPVSRDLAAMSVGAVREFRGAALHDLRQRMNTARDLLGEPDAKWSCESRPDHIRVERLQNGARYWRNPLANPKVRELAAMKVGETITPRTITAARGAGSMGSNVKVAARKAVGNPSADWVVKSHKGKPRITRTR